MSNNRKNGRGGCRGVGELKGTRSRRHVGGGAGVEVPVGGAAGRNVGDVVQGSKKSCLIPQLAGLGRPDVNPGTGPQRLAAVVHRTGPQGHGMAWARLEPYRSMG